MAKGMTRTLIRFQKAMSSEASDAVNEAKLLDSKQLTPKQIDKAGGRTFRLR